MKQVVWQEVSELIKKVNFPLWKLLDEINPGLELPLFLAKYHYGDLIVNQGVMQFPLQKDLLVTFEGLPADIQACFDSNVVPISLVLNRIAEVFSPYDNRTVPLNIIKTGQFLGLGGLLSATGLDFTRISVSAGARTTFLLPNVSDATHHKKLTNIYNAPQLIHSVFDHWAVFKKIANYRFQHRYWCCELLFFSTAWLEKIKQADTVPWLLLKNYFYEQVLVQGRGGLPLVNSVCLKNYLWNAIAACKISISDYAIDTFKYIFMMQQGQMPGFQVSDGGEQYLPEHAIQEAYIKDYKLKTYLPIIMHGAIWEDQNREFPIYYSLNLPAVFNATMPDMKNIRRTDLLQQINCVIEELALTKDYQYHYMHHHAGSVQGIEKAEAVLGNDQRAVTLKNTYPDRQISSSNTFVRGCIQVKKR